MREESIPNQILIIAMKMFHQADTDSASTSWREAYKFAEEGKLHEVRAVMMERSKEDLFDGEAKAMERIRMLIESTTKVTGGVNYSNGLRNSNLPSATKEEVKQ